MITLVYSDVAKEEIKIAAFWYEERKDTLGYDFEKEVFDKIQIIKTFPERYAPIKGSYREVKINKFPFKVIYKYNKSKGLITISSIFHTSRNPTHKYKR